MEYCYGRFSLSVIHLKPVYTYTHTPFRTISSHHLRQVVEPVLGKNYRVIYAQNTGLEGLAIAWLRGVMVAPAVVCLRWQPVPRSPADSGVLLGSEEGIQDEPTRTRPAERVRHMSTGASDDFQMQTHFHYVSAFSFDLMSQCWEEKPQSRPTFSSLVVSVANMLSDDYKKVPEFSTVESWM